jgi:MYXO-CTERM domain-containing protein
LPHDIWHAAYGNYCDVLTTYKTVQYDWLLKQSRDGSTFVDPRDPAGPAGGAGGTAAGGAAGAGGSTSGASAGGASALPSAGSANGGSAGTSTSTPSAGGGGATSVTPQATPQPATDSGCALGSKPRSSSSHWLLTLLGVAGYLARRARR